jgi:LuxR family maltose regulon positive regulatory protein
MLESEQPPIPAMGITTHRLLTEVKAHKLFPPPGRPGAVIRKQVLDRALRIGGARITVLQGPAGCGKSTALQQLMAASAGQRWAVAWLVFDDADNDPQRFESHIHAMVAAARASVSATDVAPTPRSAEQSFVDWLKTELAQFNQPVALFFDEFQVLRDATIIQTFRDLLRQLPSRSRVFIGSRSLPRVGLATLLVAGQATVVRAEELHFSADESAEFLTNGNAAPMDPTEIELIHQRTEGWPAGLQLFRLALSNPLVRGSLEELAGHGPTELAEYLSENVVSMQSPEVRLFLLQSALLRRLCGPLCDAVMQGSGSQALLQQLEREGLFLRALDATGTWYRYHGLFATHLRDSLLREDPDALTRVHRRAARWHVEHGSLEEAVYHAVEGGDTAQAIEALNAWCSQLITSGELVTVERWYTRLPLEDVVQRADLAIKVAWSLIFLRRHAALRPLQAKLMLARGSGELANTTDPDVVLAMAALFRDDVPTAALIANKPAVYQPTASGFPSFELGAASNLIAFHLLGRGDFEGTRHMLRLAEGHSERAGMAMFSQGYTRSIQGMSQLLQARPRDALRNLSVGDGPPPLGAMASAALVACQIWAAYEANELDWVEQLSERFGSDIYTAAVPDFMVVASIAISRMHEARRRPEAAQAVLDMLDRIGFESTWPRVVQVVEWERVRRALLTGNIDRAMAIKQRIDVPATFASEGWLPISELFDGSTLGAIRLAIHTSQWNDASLLLGAAQVLRPERPLLRIKLLVLEAILMQARGQSVLAQRVFSRALVAAAQGDCVRAILDEGEAALLLLQHVQHALVVPDGIETRGQVDIQDFVRGLLRTSGIEPSLASPVAPVEPLSEREVEILQLLCLGASNREIALRLTLSENTVKFHLKNVYGKLGVSSRAQAIYVARQLPLRPRPS